MAASPLLPTPTTRFGNDPGSPVSFPTIHQQTIRIAAHVALRLDPNGHHDLSKNCIGCCCRCACCHTCIGLLPEQKRARIKRAALAGAVRLRHCPYGFSRIQRWRTSRDRGSVFFARCRQSLWIGRVFRLRSHLCRCGGRGNPSCSVDNRKTCGREKIGRAALTERLLSCSCYKPRVSRCRRLGCQEIR